MRHQDEQRCDDETAEDIWDDDRRDRVCHTDLLQIRPFYDRWYRSSVAVSALDARGAVQLHTRLKPRIEEAYREVAGKDADSIGPFSAPSWNY
jgi:hypothetical protein